MTYSISRFSEITGLSIDTLRYYEKVGLIRPQRSESGYRAYTDSDVAWAQFLLRLRETAMPVREMVRYAQLRAEGDSTLRERLSMLRAHDQELKAEIARLQAYREALHDKMSWYESRIASMEADDTSCGADASEK